MDKSMRSYCGCDCAVCDWREKMNCPGCFACAGIVFHGECTVALCAIGKGVEHCGHCRDVPCARLQGYYDDPEHGDDGERLANLIAWTKEDGIG